MLEELEIIRQAQAGQADAFASLYDRYLPRIYRFVYLKTGEQHIAEDLSQQVFLSAWQNIKNYKHQGFPFSSWLYQIARNAVIDHYRTKRIHVDIDEAYEIPGPQNVVLAVSQKLEGEAIKDYIRALPQHYQDVVIMRFVEELSHREIGAAIGKSEGAVKVIQHRALQELKKLMQKDHGKNNPTTQSA